MKHRRKQKLKRLLMLDALLVILLVVCIYTLQKRDVDKPGEQNTGPHPTEALIQSGDWQGDKTEQNSEGVSREIHNGETQQSENIIQSNGTDHSLPNTTGKSLSAYEMLPGYRSENAGRYLDYKKENPDYTNEEVITYVNIGLDDQFYEGVKVIENGHDMSVLVNKYNKLPDDFVPELVELDAVLCVPGRGAQYLREEAAQALKRMHEDAKQENLSITAYGTYRSIALQQAIWENAVNSGRTVEDVDSLNSRGGHSEHHTGLAVDVIINNYSILETKEYKWYRDKAHKYGFIIRYPKGKEQITGYHYEPWHLRYVGVEIAEEVYRSGLTYEEYYVTALE